MITAQSFKTESTLHQNPSGQSLATDDAGQLSTELSQLVKELQPVIVNIDKLRQERDTIQEVLTRSRQTKEASGDQHKEQNEPMNQSAEGNLGLQRFEEIQRNLDRLTASIQTHQEQSYSNAE